MFWMALFFQSYVAVIDKWEKWRMEIYILNENRLDFVGVVHSRNGTVVSSSKYVIKRSL